MRTLLILATLILVGGCGGDEGADEPRLPLFVDMGGPKLAHPQLVLSYYTSDVPLVDYSRWLVTSPWLETVGAEYGIGAGSVLAVERPEQPPARVDESQIVDQLFAGLADGSLPMPAADTLYMFPFPGGTTVTVGDAESCFDFGPYHHSARRNGVEVAYAVIPSCDVGDYGNLDSRRITISRVLIGAATDPFPLANPGWRLRDRATPWSAMGWEVADLCARGDSTGIFTNGTYQAQRSWSNIAAAAGQDPCLPHKYDDDYFTAVTDARTPLRIRPGGRQSIRLEGWATKGIESWFLSARPARDGAATLKLGANSLGPDRSTTLDIELPSSTPVGSAITIFVFAEHYRGQEYRWNFLPVPVVAGEPCSSFSDCASCTARRGCGFCASSGRCEAMGSSGSAESSCSGTSFATWPGSCPGICQRGNASCRACTSQPGCGWCASGGTSRCMEASQEFSGPATGTCEYADWSFTESYCPADDT